LIYKDIIDLFEKLAIFYIQSSLFMKL